MLHPAVKEAVVIGIPDEVDGDLPMGVVVLRPGQSASPEEIQDFANGYTFRSLARIFY